MIVTNHRLVPDLEADMDEVADTVGVLSLEVSIMMVSGVVQSALLAVVFAALTDPETSSGPIKPA